MRIYLDHNATTPVDPAAADAMVRAKSTDPKAYIPELKKSNYKGVTSTIAFEPNGYDGKDAEFAGQAPQQDAAGRYVPYYFNKADGTVGIEPLIMTVEAGIEGWYLTPLKNGRTTLVAPYIYPVEGKDVLMSTVSVPIKDGDKGIGIATVDFDMTKLQQALAAIKPLGVGEVMLVSDAGTWGAIADPKVLGQPVAEGDPVKAWLGSSQVVQGAANGFEYFVVPVQFRGPAETWRVVIRVPEQAITGCTSSTRGTTTGVVTRGWTDPVNRRSLYRENLLQPGEFVDVTFNMQGTDKVVRAGERRNVRTNEPSTKGTNPMNKIRIAIALAAR